MKQGIDPSSHKPITETQVKDERESRIGFENPSILTQLEGQEYHMNQTGELIFSTAEHIWSTQVYDPLMLSEFQDYSNLVKPYDYNSAFNCMPNLTNLEQQKVVERDYSDSCASYAMNEVRESSSNSSNMGMQMKHDFIENVSAFSWDAADNKMESAFHHHQISEDFSNYALTSLSQEPTHTFLQI